MASGWRGATFAFRGEMAYVIAAGRLRRGTYMEWGEGSLSIHAQDRFPPTREASMLRRTLVISALAILVPSLPVSGQFMGDLHPGQKVRVTQGTRERTVGVIHSLDGANLAVIDERGELRAFPIGALSRLELHMGQRRRFAQNLLVTTAVSAGFFGVLLAALDPSGAGFGSTASRGEAFLWAAYGGALVGLPVGVGIGLLRKHDRWVEVLGPRAGSGPTLHVVPAGGGRVGVMGSVPVRW